MLNYNLAIRIINRLTSIFTKDINIIGVDGIIIASSNKKRENTYHEAARISANSNRNVIITDSNKHMYRGCKEGVNMPITYHNNVIGVVGITGTAQEVLPYAPLIKELVELIVGEMDEEHSQKVKKNKKINYFKDIIQGIDIQDIETYYSRAKLLEINIESIRKMIVFKCDDPKENVYHVTESLFTTTLRNLDIEIINLNNKKIILLIQQNIDISRYIDLLIDELNQNNISNYTFIIGEKCKKIIDYEKVYSQICLVESIEDPYRDKKVIKVRDYDLRLLVKGISKTTKNIYIENNFLQLFEGHNKLSEEMMKTVKMYFMNNMLVGQTAKAMYIHRNTVLYRLNKFKSLYGIDLSKPYECTKVFLAILINDEKNNRNA
ncbi:MAG: sugar diacid recognition domain-containing protein [Clostridium sp.]|nr:sugar diacid recognition domain-containing protein [Clostridium sp.]